GTVSVLGFAFEEQARQCIWPNRVHHCFLYGLVFRFRLLSTPSLDDAVPSATDRPVFLSDEDFHLIVGAYSQAHSLNRFAVNPTHLG
ncbi:MAG TPA: hypothetical protein VN857_07425, partial [Chthoniobacterales bacterium]|nr:hypothetical protein [Chthoniobacterales bacterium]